jgi:hypothetical protein
VTWLIQIWRHQLEMHFPLRLLEIAAALAVLLLQTFMMHLHKIQRPSVIWLELSRAVHLLLTFMMLLQMSMRSFLKWLQM